MQPFGTILLLLLSSAALVLLGHVFRLLRWEQFIRIYEYPPVSYTHLRAHET